jgi:ferredoxin
MKELPTTLCIHCNQPIFLIGSSSWSHLESASMFCSEPNKPYIACPPDDINMDEFAEAGMEMLRSKIFNETTFGSGVRTDD